MNCNELPCLDEPPEGTYCPDCGYTPIRIWKPIFCPECHKAAMELVVAEREAKVAERLAA